MDNETLTTALAEMTEWRDALTVRLLSDEDRKNGDIHLWFALMGMRNVMSKVLKAHDLDKAQPVG